VGPEFVLRIKRPRIRRRPPDLDFLAGFEHALAQGVPAFQREIIMSRHF